MAVIQLVYGDLSIYAPSQNALEKNQAKDGDQLDGEVNARRYHREKVQDVT